MSRFFVMRSKDPNTTMSESDTVITADDASLIHVTADTALRVLSLRPKGVIVSSDLCVQLHARVFLDRLGIKDLLPSVVIDNLRPVSSIDICNFDLVERSYRDTSLRPALVEAEDENIGIVHGAMIDLLDIGVKGDVLMIFGPWYATCAAMACDLKNRMAYRATRLGQAEGFFIESSVDPAVVRHSCGIQRNISKPYK